MGDDAGAQGGSGEGTMGGGGCGRPEPISLLGYLRVEVFGAEDHGVVDAQVFSGLGRCAVLGRRGEGRGTCFLGERVVVFCCLFGCTSG